MLLVMIVVAGWTAIGAYVAGRLTVQRARTHEQVFVYGAALALLAIAAGSFWLASPRGGVIFENGRWRLEVLWPLAGLLAMDGVAYLVGAALASRAAATPAGRDGA